MFEGSPQVMLKSLDSISSLDEETLIWPGELKNTNVLRNKSHTFLLRPRIRQRLHCICNQY